MAMRTDLSFCVSQPVIASPQASEATGVARPPLQSYAQQDPTWMAQTHRVRVLGHGSQDHSRTDITVTFTASVHLHYKADETWLVHKAALQEVQKQWIYILQNTGQVPGVRRPSCGILWLALQLCKIKTDFFNRLDLFGLHVSHAVEVSMLSMGDCSDPWIYKNMLWLIIMPWPSFYSCFFTIPNQHFPALNHSISMHWRSKTRRTQDFLHVLTKKCLLPGCWLNNAIWGHSQHLKESAIIYYSFAHC